MNVIEIFKELNLDPKECCLTSHGKDRAGLGTSVSHHVGYRRIYRGNGCYKLRPDPDFQLISEGNGNRSTVRNS